MEGKWRALEEDYLRQKRGELVLPRFVRNSREEAVSVLSAINRNLEECEEFLFSVAFVNAQGLLKLKLKIGEAVARGAKGRILTSDYLGFTEPRALRDILMMDGVDGRLYRTGGGKPGFHTKGYLFRMRTKAGTPYWKAIVGSSNITESALIENNEWNSEMVSQEEGEALRDILRDFERLWGLGEPLEEALPSYEKEWEEAHKEREYSEEEGLSALDFHPNDLQRTFLRRLEDVIGKGFSKGLLIAATGTGKTFASAYAVRELKGIRVRRLLYISHRERILRQAMEAYRRLMPGRRQAFYGGSEKGDAEGADFVFATFDTIRKEEHLARFRKDEFDMVVIDEVHRVGENHYQDIIGHFEPSFLLGMSATPDRSDGYDLYGLFDNDIILEIRLPDALEEKMLVPFSYFGIGKITIDGRERDFEDFSALEPEEMARQIVEKSRYFGYSGDRLRALVFVSGRGSERKGARKVEEVALALRKLGIRAEGITAATPLRERNARIERLDGPEGAEALDMLVALDVLNEGVDIPNVNQIIMARPTDSPIVFLQQLGRGLRLARGKEYVVVLDFIGNYEKGNYLIPASFTRKMEGHCSLLTMMENPFLPGVSTIQFDKVARERVMRSIAKSKLLGNRRLEEAWEDLSRRIQGKGKDAPRVPSLKDFEVLSPYSARFFLDRTGGFRHDNYQEFLHRIRPEDFPSLPPRENGLLSYLCPLIGNGMRAFEPLLLKLLLQGPEGGIPLRGGTFEETLLREWEEVVPSQADGYLRTFFGGGFRGGRKIEGLSQFGKFEAGIAELSPWVLDSYQSSPWFRKQMDWLIEIAFHYRKSRFGAKREGPWGFVPYEQYRRFDVTRLLFAEKDYTNTFYGYQVLERERATPIFVTYQKDVKEEESIAYQDKLLDPSHFLWVSRNNLTLESPEIRKLIRLHEEGGRIPLFLTRKRDEDGGAFLYLGEARIDQEEGPREAKMRGGQDVVEFPLILQHPVRKDIYDYLRLDAEKESERLD